MVSLKALERLDALDGIVPARERKNEPEKKEPPAPMFVLPLGSEVDLFTHRSQRALNFGNLTTDAELCVGCVDGGYAGVTDKTGIQLPTKPLTGLPF